MERNIKCNVKQSVIVIFAGIGLLAICFFCVFFDFRQFIGASLFNSDIVYLFTKGIMIFAFVFLGCGVSAILRNVLFYRDRIIEIGDDSLVDRSSLVCCGKIRYEEISSVDIRGMYLCINLHEEEQFLNRQNFLKRFLMRTNKKIGYEYPIISGNLLDTDLHEIKKMIDEKLSH